MYTRSLCTNTGMTSAEEGEDEGKAHQSATASEMFALLCKYYQQEQGQEVDEVKLPME